MSDLRIVPAGPLMAQVDLGDGAAMNVLNPRSFKDDVLDVGRALPPLRRHDGRAVSPWQVVRGDGMRLGDSGMKSDDWRDMDSAPLNPYGKAYGPTVLLWCSNSDTPVAAYYQPFGSVYDNKPRWTTVEEGAEIPCEDAVAWMPIAAPLRVRMKRPPEGNEIGDGNSWEFCPTVGWIIRDIQQSGAAEGARAAREGGRQMIDREKVERLIAALEQHGRRWKVGDDASEKRSADCTNASDTLRALSARVAELEAGRDEALRRRDAWKERAENHPQIVDALKAKTAGQDSRTLSKALLGAAFNQCEAELAEARARVASVVEQAAGAAVDHARGYEALKVAARKGNVIDEKAIAAHGSSQMACVVLGDAIRALATDADRDALAERDKRIRAEERERLADFVRGRGLAIAELSDDYYGEPREYASDVILGIAADIRKGDEDE